MAEWLRPRTSIAENGLNIRQISVGLISCPSKKSIGWAAGVKITFRRYHGRRKKDLEDRMAEWLRPQTSIAENGLNIRWISVGSISCPSKKYICWANGVKITSRRYYGWHRLKFEKSRMAEWLRPLISIAENGLNIRRISVGLILSLKEDHRLGGW